MSTRKYVLVGTAAETTVTVEREWAVDAPAQGLVLDADDPMTVGDVESSRIVLWSDTAPERVEVLTGDAGDLRVWNVWRDGDLIQAWEGAAHIEVDDDGDDLGLACHDGGDDETPSLVVRLRFDRSWTQPPDEG